MIENTTHPTKEMATAIGQFVQKFNGLEQRLTDIIGVLLNSEDVAKGEIVGAALMFRAKCNLVKALVDHIGGADSTQAFGDIDSRLRQVNEVRNDLVHGEQWLDFDGVMRQRRARVTDGGYRPKHTKHSPQEVSEWVLKTWSLEGDVWNFVQDLLTKTTPVDSTKSGHS